MRALVTGGAGFIGSHLCDRLILEGHDVLSIDNLVSGYEKNVGNYENEAVDVTDTHSLRIMFERFKPDIVFHNAASKKRISDQLPSLDLQVNEFGTLNILQLSMEFGVKKFVHASTGSVYGNSNLTLREEMTKRPVSYYGISKLAGENYVTMFNSNYGLETTVLRYFHVYGERQESGEYGGVIAIWKRQLEIGEKITIHGDGMQTRSFTHVSDVVEANIRSIDCQPGKVFNIASGEEIVLKDVATHYFGVKERDILYGQEIQGDIHDFNVNNRESKLILGIDYMSFKEGFEQLVGERVAR